MEGREKPHMDKYKEITNDWNYDTSCMLTLLPVWNILSTWILLYRVYLWTASNLKNASPNEGIGDSSSTFSSLSAALSSMSAACVFL
jgi:hypothetical protein